MIFTHCKSDGRCYPLFGRGIPRYKGQRPRRLFIVHDVRAPRSPSMRPTRRAFAQRSPLRGARIGADSGRHAVETLRRCAGWGSTPKVRRCITGTVRRDGSTIHGGTTVIARTLLTPHPVHTARVSARELWRRSRGRRRQPTRALLSGALGGRPRSGFSRRTPRQSCDRTTTHLAPIHPPHLHYSIIHVSTNRCRLERAIPHPTAIPSLASPAPLLHLPLLLLLLVVARYSGDAHSPLSSETASSGTGSPHRGDTPLSWLMTLPPSAVR